MLSKNQTYSQLFHKADGGRERRGGIGAVGEGVMEKEQVFADSKW